MIPCRYLSAIHSSLPFLHQKYTLKKAVAAVGLLYEIPWSQSFAISSSFNQVKSLIGRLLFISAWMLRNLSSICFRTASFNDMTVLLAVDIFLVALAQDATTFEVWTCDIDFICYVTVLNLKFLDPVMKWFLGALILSPSCVKTYRASHTDLIMVHETLSSLLPIFLIKLTWGAIFFILFLRCILSLLWSYLA